MGWSSDVCSSDLVQQRLELLAAERHVLGGPLHLDDAAGCGQHEVGVGRRRGILGIVEVEHLLAAMDAAGHCGDLRSEERRGGEECVCTCRYRWSLSL